jgi:hypothetical protein
LFDVTMHLHTGMWVNLMGTLLKFEVPTLTRGARGSSTGARVHDFKKTQKMLKSDILPPSESRFAATFSFSKKKLDAAAME